MRIILASVGSLGDAHPFLAIGKALAERGHAVSIITNREHAAAVRSCGLGFLSAGDTLNPDAAAASPNLWHPVKGLGVLWKHMLAPAILPTFQHIAEAGRCLVVASPFMFGARLAREKLGTPLLSAYTAPGLLRSTHAPLTVADWRVPACMPRIAMRWVWALLDRYKLEPMARPALSRARQEIGLDAPVGVSIVGRWMHSPDGGFTLFPDWFGPTKPDWPEGIESGGFPLFDDASNAGSPEALQHFLAGGGPPVVCMPGSAMQHAERFFAAVVESCGRLGLRCVLLTSHEQQLPLPLPPHVLHLPYVPFGSLLPRAACLVHHGGIGSCAQALRSGVPQIVMPMSHDQFDNAFQVERLGVGRAIAPARFDAARLTSTLRRVLADAVSSSARQRLRDRIAAEPALPRLCHIIERRA